MPRHSPSTPVECPPVPRSWFKGADTTSLLIYLEHKLEDALPLIDDNDVRRYFALIHAAVCSANAFLRVFYHSNLWLANREADVAIAEGQQCLDTFQKLASTAFDWGLTRWKIQPKYHMVGEILFDMRSCREAGLPVLNPLCWSTQQDEDFVGRVSAISRHVDARTIHERTISRYQLALASRWR